MNIIFLYMKTSDLSSLHSYHTYFYIYIHDFYIERIFLPLYFFNWRIIALQNFVIFCQTSTRVSHRYTPVPSLSNLPPISLTITPLDCYRPLFEFPESCRKFPLAIYFTYGNVSFHVTLSTYLTHASSPAPTPISLFSMCVSPMLPWK